MKVRITGVGLVVGEGHGPILGFEPREHVKDRKHVKLMSRAVQLGLAGIKAALAARPGWESIPPDRRGMYVGATPSGSEPEELAAAVDAAWRGEGLDVGAFGVDGIPLVPPLWLVKGLSNNVLGYASAYWDFQGVNGSRCDGAVGGLAALLDGARAIAEGRAELVVAGGADSLVGAERWLGEPCGEGAAFFVLEPGGSDASEATIEGELGRDPRCVPTPSGRFGALGAASGVVEFAEALGVGARVARVEVRDTSGAWVWVEAR